VFVREQTDLPLTAGLLTGGNDRKTRRAPAGVARSTYYGDHSVSCWSGLDPEAIEKMSAAFVATCDALHLKIGDDPATRFVAEKIIQFAQRGIRDPDMLRKLTLKEFNLSDESIRASAPQNDN
jgi:hypothetical protein